MTISKLKQYKNHMRGPAYDSILLTFVRIVTVVLGIVVTKLLSIHFTLDDYGTYTQATLIVTTASSLSILGLTNAVNYFYNSSYSDEKKEHYISTIFVIEYVVGIVCALAIIAGNGLIIGYFDNERLRELLYIAALMPLLQNLLPMLQVLFVSIGSARLIAIRNLVFSLARLAVVLIACYITKRIQTIFIVLLVLDILQILYFMIVFSSKKFSIRVGKFKAELLKPVLVFCIPMAVYVMTNGLSRDIDKYIIGYFTDTSTLAIYSNAAKILPFDLITASFITVLVPIVTRQVSLGNYERVYASFKAYLRLGYVATWIVASGAVVNAKEMMLFLYDKKYLPGLSVFIVYLLVDMIKFANTSLILTAKGKTKTLMVCSLSMLAANLIISVILYKIFGMLGPAVATFTVTFLFVIVMLSISAKEIDKHFLSLFNWKEMLVITLEILGVGSLCFVLKRFVYLFSESYFVVLLASYSVFLAVMLLLNRRRIISCLKDIGKLN